MNDKRIQIWIALVAGLSLVIVFLLASNAAASLPEPGPTFLDPLTPHTDASRIAQTTSGWSSGWIAVTAGSGVTLTHNLGGDPDDYAVELLFADVGGGYGINVRGYGGMEAAGNWYGAAWQNLTSNTIQIIRYANDTFADLVRVRVWVPDPLPDYCSDWTSIGQGSTAVFTHSLGGDVDDYVAALVFSSTLTGINHRAYGGIMYNAGAATVGAYWSNLTTSTVRVWRHWDDPFTDQVRVCITQPDPPDYDSGWVTVTQGAVTTFTHDLGGATGLYRVRLDAWEPAFGINHHHAGGDVENVTPVGANWENLTNSAVSVFNRSGPHQARIRIWTTKQVYLPLVLRNF